MNFVHRFLSSWFGFNKQQRNGVIVLCFIILLLFIFRLSIRFFIHPQPFILADFSNTKLPVSAKKEIIYSDTLPSTEENLLFVFNPNTVNKEQLLKLGFSLKAANTFINYRNKGAFFKKKEDIKKVYGVTEALYLRIEPYILIEERKETNTKNELSQKSIPKKEIKLIELNSADSASLLPLPGIGGSYARRILKYRNLLGGFYTTVQMKEIYGFSDSLFLIIKDHVTTDISLLKKLDLNTENFKELNAHPYISYEETKAIFNYRRKNGLLKTKEQVKEILSSETFNKIEPYLGL